MVDISVGDYVDVLCSDRSWRVAKVEEVSSYQGFYVSYFGHHTSYSEWISSSARIAAFRTKTKGATWDSSEDLEPLAAGERKYVKDLIAWVTNSRSQVDCEAKWFITEFRGRVFIDVVTALMTTAEAENTLDLLGDWMYAFVWWLDFIKPNSSDMQNWLAAQKTANSPEAAYEGVDIAVASMAPEFFEVFQAVMKLDSPWKARLAEVTVRQSTACKTQLAKDGRRDLQEFAWHKFIQSQGRDVLLSLLHTLYEALSTGIKLAMVEKLPFWEAHRKLALDDMDECVEMAGKLIVDADVSAFEGCDPPALAKLVSCCHSYYTKHFQVEEAAQMVTKLLEVIVKLLQVQALEKRVSAAATLSKLVDSFHSESRAFAQDFLLATQQTLPLQSLMSPLHAEILTRSQSFLTWAVRNDLVSADVVSSLWSALVESHETVRQKVCDVIVKSIVYASQRFVQAMSEELGKTHIDSFDDILLDFLKRCLTEMNESDHAQGFSEALMARLSDPALKPCKASSEIIANLLTRQTFLSFAQDYFSRHLSQAMHSLQSLEFLELFLAELRKAGFGIENFLQPAEKFVDACIDGLNAARASPDAALFLSAWLRCIDSAANLYSGHSANPYLTSSQFLQVWSAIVQPPYTHISILFHFFANCQSPWFGRRILLPLLESLVPKDPTLSGIDVDAKKLSPWMSQISVEDFDGLFALYGKTVLKEFDSSRDLYVYSEVKNMTEVAVLALCGILPNSRAVRMRCINQLAKLAECSNIPDLMREPVVVVLNLIAEKSNVLTALEMLEALFQYEAKYRKSLWHEDDLQVLLDEVERTHPPWIELLGNNFRSEITQNLEKVAHNGNVPYHVLKFVDGSETKFPSIITHHYRQINLDYCIEEYGVTIIATLLTVSGISESQLAWKILEMITPKLKIFQSMKTSITYGSKLIGAPLLPDRIIWLHIVAFMSEDKTFSAAFIDQKNNVRALFGYLELTDVSEEAINVHFFRLVVYCELMLKLMSKYFWSLGDSLESDVGRTLDILCTIALYYQHRGTESAVRTDSFTHALSLFHLYNDYSWENFAPAMHTLMQRALMDSKCQQFAQECKQFCKALTEISVSIADIQTRFLMEKCESAFRREEKPTVFFDLFVNVVATRIKDIPHSEFFQLLPSQILNSDFFWSQSSSLCETLLKLLAVLESLYSIDVRKGIVDNLLQWLFHFHPRYINSSKVDSEIWKASFALLHTLGERDSAIQLYTQESISVFFRSMSWRKQNNWSLDYRPHSVTPLIGITNLGATCYMSATFQQLQTIDSFVDRLFVLQQEEMSPFLEGLVAFFAKLKFKRRGKVSPKALISVMDASINLSEQTDIEEFYNTFMHRLEADLSKTSQSQLVSTHFKGRMCTTLLCKGGCKSQRKRYQDFLVLSLNVKGNKTIKESLDAMVRGEIMGEDNAISCEQCGVTARTECSQSILILPRVLFCSLRRFDYDIQKGQRRKINDYFEFPQELCLKQYCTNQGLPDDYYQYRLRGVAIHSGLADSGHYYSLVKRDNTWVRFDDTNVEENIESIDREAFGSVSASQAGRSAYLLIYEREQLYAYQEDTGDQHRITLPEPQPSAVAQGHLTALDNKLRNYWQLQQLLSPEFAEYMLRTLDLPRLTAATFKSVLSYFLTIHCRKGTWTNGVDFLRKLLAKMTDRADISMLVLELLSHPGVLEEFLVSCPSVAVRKSCVLLFRTAVRTASEDFTRKTCTRVMCKIGELEKPTAKDYAQLFEVLAGIVQRSPETAKQLGLDSFLMAKLFNFQCEVPLPSAFKDVFSPEWYLGHPTAEYSTRKQPSKTTHVGFHLLLITKLMSPDMATSLVQVLENVHEWADIKMETYFERKQMGLFLHSCYQMQPELIQQMLSFWLEMLYFVDAESVNSFFDVVHVLINSAKGSLLLYLLQLLFPEKLQPKFVETTINTLILHMFRLFSRFPKHEAWGDERVVKGLQRWTSLDKSEESRAKLTAMLDRDPRGLTTGSIPIEYYDQCLTEDRQFTVSHNGQKKVMKVVASFGIVHVLKASNSPHYIWVAAEDDMSTVV